MIATLALVTVVTLSPAAPPCRTDSPTADLSCEAGTPPADSTLQALYLGGQPFAEFLDDARRRRDAWHANHDEATVPQGLLERAEALSGSWKLLVVAIDGCSDSVSTIPYVARLVASVESLEMRIVDSRVGRGVMEAHRTDDGRAATPTLVLMDEGWNEVGCLVERPQALVAWLEDHTQGMSNQDFYTAKMDWYAEDAGISTLRQLVETMEAADRGETVCR